MLSGDDNIVDSYRLDEGVFSLILNNHLRLAIWSQPGDGLGVPLVGHLLTDLVGKVVRVRVKGLSVPFVGGITEHDALISSSDILIFLICMN